MILEINSIDLFITAGIAFATVLVAVTWFFVSLRIGRGLSKKTTGGLAEYLLSATRKPLLVLTLLSGFYLAAWFFPWNQNLRSYVNRGALLLGVLLTYVLAALIVSGITWYETKLKTQGGAGIAGWIIPWARGLIKVLAGLAGLFLILDMLGLDITPAMIGLGKYGGRIALIFGLSLVATVGIARGIPRMIETAIPARAG